MNGKLYDERRQFVCDLRNVQVAGPVTPSGTSFSAITDLETPLADEYFVIEVQGHRYSGFVHGITMTGGGARIAGWIRE